MTAKALAEAAYTLKITLSGSKPPIWRRFCLPGAVTLDRLHDVIQIVMGWQETHLHRFEIAHRCYEEKSEESEADALNEGEYRLCDLVAGKGDRFTYEYDFGDGWRHVLLIEAVTRPPAGHGACVACLDGRRRCPPEDVGGSDGYAEFLSALGDPDHPERASYLEWCGGDFDPAAFDLDAVNLELAKYVRWARPRTVDQELWAGRH